MSFALLLGAGSAGIAEEASKRPAVWQSLRLDPAIFADVAQVWEVIGSADNPVWPGWNASTTPVLIYFPGEQEVLLNHPHPPADYIRADGLLPLTRRPTARVWVRNGKTQFDSDGQNTRTEINGVSTLVVADTSSNMRSSLRSLLRASGPAAERDDQLTLDALSSNPYKTLAMIAHEAFHVFQHAHAAEKEVSEGLLLEYPTLSVDNNLGVALEGRALAAALRARTTPEVVKAAREVMAVRAWRRRLLPANAVTYEDGTEFTEGLAKFVEYALIQALEGRKPIAEMAWVRGFAGFEDMSGPRATLVQALIDNTDGTNLVNNDPFGAAPVRFRLYYSGMALAAVLDRLGAHDWRTRILRPGTTLTGLLTERLGSFDQQAVLKAALHSNEAAQQRGRVERLASDGRIANQALLTSILTSVPETPSWRLEIDYSALGAPRASFGYTPFGTTTLSPSRVIYKQVRVSGTIETGGKFKQLQPSPLLHDRNARTVTFRIDGGPPKIDVVRASAGSLAGFTLPGVTLDFAYGEVHVRGDTVVIRLVPKPTGLG
ncbi:hypothetical protein C8J41_1091 [Sphingomonas sp. PP-CC-3G-468]|nr:hypothetical protein C8J41_1091 [Sphingomonas sp. PP-CC-3G-468]